ncbi:MAG TPA: DUF3667 domain-containing protein [Cyclobacteriaceae bacterium]|nr:DUF3667 domain-containing protein [Cyclobacteriaceae bacterium]
MADETVHTCKSCNHQFTGIYCNNCGEKIRVAADRTFKSFLNDFVRAVTLADNKFARTLWLILSKPGFVSREVADGRTVRYLGLVQVFFVLNLVYFLFPIVQLFSASLTTQMMAPLGFLLKQPIARKMASMHLNLESFALVYNFKSVTLAKLLVMVFVVFASMPLNFLYRKRNRFFTDHFGYAVELACFNLFVNAIAVDVITSVIPIGHYIGEGVVTGLFIATNLYFLLRSSGTFYNEHGWRLVVKSAMMILFLKVALELYRIVLFFVTLWSL